MKYKTASAFAMALRQQLAERQQVTGIAVERLRQLIAFDRLMARFSAVALGHLIKGGFVLELRLDRARTTRDVDVSLYGDPADLEERIIEAGLVDLGDFFQFTFKRPSKVGKAVIDGPGVRYGGQRFRCTCLLGGQMFSGFGLDVAIADPPACEPDYVDGLDWLTFAGIEAGRHPVLSREHHIAQKLHAYTLPRPEDRPNSRLQDLPDLVHLARTGVMRASHLRDAIDSTFRHRMGHALPTRLPPPPANWAESYPAKAVELGLPEFSLDEVYAAARAFVDPILASNDDAEWDPDAWVWRSPA